MPFGWGKVAVTNPELVWQKVNVDVHASKTVSFWKFDDFCGFGKRCNAWLFWERRRTAEAGNQVMRHIDGLRKRASVCDMAALRNDGIIGGAGVPVRIEPGIEEKPDFHGNADLKREKARSLLSFLEKMFDSRT